MGYEAKIQLVPNGKFWTMTELREGCRESDPTELITHEEAFIGDISNKVMQKLVSEGANMSDAAIFNLLSEALEIAYYAGKRNPEEKFELTKEEIEKLL